MKGGYKSLGKMGGGKKSGGGGRKSAGGLAKRMKSAESMTKKGKGKFQYAR